MAKLYTVEVTFRVPVWAESPEAAEGLARSEICLSDYDCDPWAVASEDSGACETDEVPIGGRGKALADLVKGEGEA